MVKFIKGYLFIMVLIFFSIVLDNLFNGLGYGFEDKAIKGNFTILLDKPDTHERGKVTITVFIDFFCPHCHKFDTQVVPILKEEYGKRLNFVFIGYPLLYEDSIIPIEIYELAKDQGKGDEMRESLFKAIYKERKDVTNKAIFLQLAKDLDLDVKAFKFGFDSHIKRKKIRRDSELAKGYEVKGTPTIIIDGRIKVRDNSLENMRTIINSILGFTAK